MNAEWNALARPGEAVGDQAVEQRRVRVNVRWAKLDDGGHPALQTPERACLWAAPEQEDDSGDGLRFPTVHNSQH